MLNVKTAHHFHTKLRKELGDIYRLQLHYTKYVRKGLGGFISFI